jgi:hypothetical protein
MALIANIDPRRVGMDDLQANIVGHDLPRQLPTLLSIPGLQMVLRAATGGSRFGLLALSLLPTRFHAMPSSQSQIRRGSARSAKSHNLSNGVEPLSFLDSRAQKADF